MDGGSTDHSVEIIKRYEKSLAHWESAPDGGQAAAINRGFAKATGDILGWINSDDLYMPGALFKVATQIGDVAQPKIIFGNCLHFTEGSPATVKGSDVERSAALGDLKLADHIIQPSSFWTRKTFMLVGNLQEDFHYVFDWEWFIRAQLKGISVMPVPYVLSLYRRHDQHKTGIGGERRTKEIDRIYKKYNSGNALQAQRRVRLLKRFQNENVLLRKIFKQKKLLYLVCFSRLITLNQFRAIWQ
jgi:glycosyltransferase involved in cell wall biosynthesis